MQLSESANPFNPPPGPINEMRLLLVEMNKTYVNVRMLNGAIIFYNSELNSENMLQISLKLETSLLEARKKIKKTLWWRFCMKNESWEELMIFRQIPSKIALQSN